jgi:hypothetical protein
MRALAAKQRYVEHPLHFGHRRFGHRDEHRELLTGQGDAFEEVVEQWIEFVVESSRERNESN